MSKAIILTAFLGVIMLCGLITPVDAAQMTFRTFSETGNTEEAEIKFQRSVIINYDDGGQLADQLRGLKISKVFSADSSTPGVNELRDRINYFLKNTADSSAVVTDIDIDYDTTLTGRGLNTSIDYKVIMTLHLSHHIVRDASGGTAGLLDMDWRGVAIDGPVVLNVRGIDNEINLPISFIADASPVLYSAVQGTEAEVILNTPLIDASGIKAQPLGNWHFLFDPTGINVDASQFGMSDELAGFVWSSYTMGESSLREGIQTEKEKSATFTTDKTYDLRTIESADAANLFVAGFANIDPTAKKGTEVVGFYPEAPEGFATTSTGGFPMMIIYGMAGMAGVAGVIVFMISERKRKYEKTHTEQTGIDPSRLRAAGTSAGAGGYQTNRGESYLAGEDYAQHRSVYDNPQVEEKPAEEEKQESTKGSMPKGWKPE